MIVEYRGEKNMYQSLLIVRIVNVNMSPTIIATCYRIRREKTCTILILILIASVGCRCVDVNMSTLASLACCSALAI